MSLISQDILSFKGGVSQQPPIIRYPDQLEEQINGFSSEVYGLQKRPPSVRVGKLNTTLGDKPTKWHVINRDINERYFVRIVNGDLEVFDFNGNKLTVNFPNGKAYLSNISNPENDLKLVTVADYTFIVNTKVKVEMENYLSDGGWENCTLYWVKTSNYGRVFSIRVNNREVANMITADGGSANQALWATTDIVARALWKSMNGDGDDPNGGYPKDDYSYDSWVAESGTAEWGYTHWTTGSPLPSSSWNRGLLGSSVLYLQRKDRSTFQSDVRDGYGGQSMLLIRNEVDNVNKLPVVAPEGYIIKVKGRSYSSTDDDYYVKWVSAKSVWQECVAPNHKYKLKNSTMPWGLVREANGTFTFKQLNWDEREAGDDDSNPVPSFVGHTINDIFFFRNRLGFISGENIILSESSSFFNFWFKSSAVIADTDPIDVAVSDNKVVNLTHAIPFSRELILFSREGQFVLSSDGTMTPKSVKCDKITGFVYKPTVAPINIGASIYFFNTRVDYGSLMRFYTVQDVSDLKDAEDCSAHIPSYIPNDIQRLSGNTTFDIVTLVNKSNIVYLYKYIIQSGQELQQSWSKWDFGDRVEVHIAEVIDDTIWLIFRNKVGGNFYIEKLSLRNNLKDFSNEPYRVFLDHKISVKLPEGSTYYDDYSNTTTYSLSDLYSDSTGASEFSDGYLLVDLKGFIQDFTGTKITLSGDWRGRDVIVGKKVPVDYQLSTIKIKQGNNGAVTSENAGRLQLRYFWVNFADSGVFTVKVKDTGRNQEYSYKATSKYFSKSDNIMGKVTLHSGKFKIPVQRNTDDVAISIVDDSPLPLMIVSGGWEGLYARRTQKV